jgi:hypothetical protein
LSDNINNILGDNLNKKGETPTPDAGNISVLILVIIGAIIIYVLFVSPDVREELLSDDDSEDNGNGDSYGPVLLKEKPGRIEYIEDEEFEHEIPSFYLYQTTTTEEIKRLNSIYIKEAVFDHRSRAVTFSISDLENTENVRLDFQVRKSSGVLDITLNGEIIFSGELDAFEAEPITLPEDLLAEENILEFSVSEVGWMIWLSNEYSLMNVKILGDVTDVSRQKSRNVFHISEAELNNIKTSTLQFSPECVPERAGNLDIQINFETVFSGVPECGFTNTIEFSPTLLEIGSNNVVFTTDRGDYVVDRLSIDTEMKESPEVIYYFEISDERYEEISEGDKEVELTLQFVQEGDVKEAKIVVNGRETGVYTREKEFTRKITQFVQEENNAIKIVPKTSLDIIKLTIEIVE